MPTVIRREATQNPRSRAHERSFEPLATLDPLRVMDALFGWEAPRETVGWRRAAEAFVPRFDVKEIKDGYLFRADMPGLKESDLDISMTGNVLTVSGRREPEPREEGEQYYAAERSYGAFSRSFALPDGADTDSVAAELKDGVLTIRLAKKPEVQPKKITIGGGTVRS